MKSLLFILLLPALAVATPTVIRHEADQSPVRLEAELAAAGFPATIKPFASYRKSGGKVMVTKSNITFDHELSQAELAAAQAVIDAHEGNEARKARLDIRLKVLIQKMRDTPQNWTAANQIEYNLIICKMLRMDE